MNKYWLIKSDRVSFPFKEIQGNQKLQLLNLNLLHHYRLGYSEINILPKSMVSESNNISGNYFLLEFDSQNYFIIVNHRNSSIPIINGNGRINHNGPFKYRIDHNKVKNILPFSGI